MLSFGKVPLSGTLLAPPQLLKDEATYPLDVVFCSRCSLLQLIQTVSPSTMYDWTVYRDPPPPSMQERIEARQLAERLIAERRLGPDSLVVEIASGEGALLREFQARHVSVLGIEPASGPANRAREAGVPTLAAFFSRDLAQYLKSEDKRGDVVIARDVLARVPDLHGFLGGIRTLLKDEGIALIEVPYVRELVDQNAFDALNDEQLCYFSLSALVDALEAADLWPGRVELTGPDRGMLRLHVAAVPGEMSPAHEYVKAEAYAGVGSASYYRGFGERAAETRAQLRTLLGGLRREGKRIVAYGASSAGTTLLNFAGLDHEYVDFVVDEDTQRQGRFVPGVHLPVLSPESLLSDIPDFLLLLDRSGEDSLQAVRPALKTGGTRFIVPTPTPIVI